MKAFWINDCDIWAGVDLEHAIAAAVKATGVPREELVDESAICEADPDMELVDPEGVDEPTTVGATVAAMKTPGLVGSTEY